MSIQKHFQMQRDNVKFLLDLIPSLWCICLLTMITLSFSPLARATAPVDEIYSIISTKALQPHASVESLKLDANHLEEWLKVMDPYARYIPPATLRPEKKPLHLGVEIFKYKSIPWIQTVPDGPAYLAGLPEVSTLLTIDYRNVQGYNLSQISTLLDEAMQKDTVIIMVADKPEGIGKNYTIKPVINTNKIRTITWRRIDNYIVMHISQFLTRYTATELSAIYNVLVDQETKVILDLRGCTGGDLYEALEVAGMFIPANQPLVNTYDRNGTATYYRSMSGQKLKSPIGVLIDNRTASAAEILAGTLQFYHLSRVVGDQSYGKCLSMTFVPLSNGGELWFTSRAIRFPDNSSCTGKGIKPDIKIPDISVIKLPNIMEKAFSARRARLNN